MLIRSIQRRNVQVKCNFCMEWMNLNTDVKFKINVCDGCLNQGASYNSLLAVSSQGQIYQLYMIKQNSCLSEEDRLDYLSKSFSDTESK
jgi:hypothetical protein